LLPLCLNTLAASADTQIVAHFVSDPVAKLDRFNQLIEEVLQGQTRRTCFEPWEVRLLIDLDGCRRTGAGSRRAIRRYQRAVQRVLDQGATEPIPMSSYLAGLAEFGKALEDEQEPHHQVSALS
jgi:hypothetical protein